MTRSGWIDALRGLAACAVAFFHFNEPEVTWAVPPWMEAWKGFWKFGHVGVPVFFVLSGYCIGATALRAPSAGDFLRRRVRRIFPAYWASVVLIVLLAVGRRAATGVNDLVALPSAKSLDWLATFTLTTAPVTSAKTLNWVYWSLSFELAFYALVAGAVLLAAPARRPQALAAVSTLTVALGLFHAPKTGPFFFLSLWPLFALGLVPLLLSKDRAAAVVIGLGCAVHFLAGAFRGADMLYPFVALWVVLALLAFQRVERPAPAALRHVGEWSYSIYLLHVPVACYALRWLTGPPSGPGADAALQVLQLAVTLALAAFSYRWFEKPFLSTPAARVAAPAAIGSTIG